MRIAPSDLELIKSAENALLLGIITVQSEIRLKEADAVEYPGHVEWLAKEPIEGVVRGFSLLVHNGEVCAIFPRSRLNPAPDARLETDRLDELLRVLPVASKVRIFE